MKQIARPMYSNPPIHGARIVDEVLGNPELTASWHADLRYMSGRIDEMRTSLVEKLKSHGSEHDWSHITNQIGMFAFTGLNPEMVKEIEEKHSCFLTKDGRISIAGLNTGNIDYVAEAMHQVSKGKKL
jgi:aspartate aminotransferase